MFRKVSNKNSCHQQQQPWTNRRPSQVQYKRAKRFDNGLHSGVMPVQNPVRTCSQNEQTFVLLHFGAQNPCFVGGLEADCFLRHGSVVFWRIKLAFYRARGILYFPYASQTFNSFIERGRTSPSTKKSTSKKWQKKIEKKCPWIGHFSVPSREILFPWGGKFS